MNFGQLRDFIVRPALQHLDFGGRDSIPYTLAAERLVCGTILTESRGEYVVQLGGGPALGIGQMESFTHDDLWRWLDGGPGIGPGRPELAARVRELTTPAAITRGAVEMVGNHWYAAAMVRVFYRRLREAVPPAGDPLAMAKLWKLRYNTPLGAGTVSKALPYFRTACGV